MQHLIRLFEKYMREEKIPEALVVGQFMFNQDSGNTEIFEKYVGILLELATDYHTPIAVCRSYCDKAELVVEFYAENVELHEDLVYKIMHIRERVYEIREGLDARENEDRKVFVKKKVEENDEILSVLQRLLQKLIQITQKAEFDKVLEQIQQLDEVLNKEYLVERQEKMYQQISKECANLVDAKIRYFKRKDKAEYNLKALEAYEKAYRMLKNAENIGESEEIIKNLFIFDASKLFNETLVYYNHVYSYILSKMDDKGKFNLTKLAIQCEKKYRNTQ